MSAYGPDAFGPDKEFVSAQASVVATMVSGIPSVPAFVLGLAGGLALYFARLPAMMLGLGVYLPFYMSVTAALGAVARIVYEQVSARRNAGLSEAERQEAAEKAQESGLVVASGLLGGESVMGVIIAFASIFASMA